jgi:hypothetical protein
MHARQIDPRNVAWEKEQRTYRVYFQQLDDEYGPGKGKVSEEWEITDADLSQVLTWISDHSRNLPFTLYAYIADDKEPGLLHLMTRAGAQPGSSSSG